MPNVIKKQVEVPQQTNLSDCAFFVIHMMNLFCKQAPMRFQLENLEMMHYIWTDERLQVLITTFWTHVQSEKTYRSHSELLNYLKQPLLKLADEEANDFPTENDISEKLTDLANCYKFKGSSDYKDKRNDHRAFRIRIGKDMRFLFDRLVEFEDYELYDTTFSRSTRSSSRLSSSSRSLRMTDRRKAESMAEMDQVSVELGSLGLLLSED
ncbi:hypothetical protein POM88_047490 [Heracleum sosnowskyi]|uniref:Ubiquitin-like protease family profile domain-containing protein n=1 Tax=Heracleum sosnowskyi TaxID=360622 RepID=A0AAD8GTL3_9APIA|nr:hypothetical protein POM88_047490 [Heracleum sosnowskyi]